MRRVVPLIALTALAACSTSPVPLSRATSTPSERIFSPTLAKTSDGAQKITIVRDSGLKGSAFYTTVYVDGVRAADVDTSEAVRIYLQPGVHILSAGPRGMSTGPSVPVTVPSATTQYRISEGLFLLPAE
ncbi:hypothetical protein [Caballeronia grimmiae]|uniref:hypothetical protein n=1 Tax=Caballeronia grimmiae TaxID=1071679 RepID=UPI0038B86BF8